MKKILLLTIAVLGTSLGHSQSDKFWSAYKGDTGKITTDKAVSRISFPKEFDLYDLNLTHLRQTLFSMLNSTTPKRVVISLPNADGALEQFEMYEASNFEADLQAQFPEIRAYSGKGITDRYATLKLSISPQGIQTMIFRTDKPNEFIEPYSQDHKIYAVFKSQRNSGSLPWSCSVKDKEMFDGISNKIQNFTNKSSAGQLKTMRLAQSVTGEYSNYFGATNATQVGLVLAAINNTLTRCNGVYEKDLALHLNLVAQSTNVIFYDPATDPYSDATVGTALANSNNANGWNIQLQNTLSTSLTGTATPLATNNAAYDIGHLFGGSGGGGNAGCIGCVCVNDTSSTLDKNKGSGYTSPADGIPMGDNFDIDYVVHEVGHQLGGNHTFSMSNEGSGVNMEVGSGVTIMGYAGITSQDVAPHSIDTYHAASIAQIQANLAGKTCPVTTTITANNATPVANAGADYTIPKSTPFKLTGSATDANAGDALTYSWEQYDDDTAAQTGAASAASATKATGPNWRSYSATTTPVRYFPVMSSVLNGSTTTAGTDINVEALSSVARTLNFRLTVRDNAAFSSSAPIKVAQTNFDDMVVTVDATKGPLTVTSQSTAGITWNQGSSQTITWTVNNTNTLAGGSNVDILLSTDGGQTFTTPLATNIPNNGSATITVPNITSQMARVMVKANGNIFFNVNSKNIAIGYTVSTNCNSYTMNTPFAIPDNNTAYTTRQITVPATSGNISDVNLAVNVNHTYISDVNIALLSPAGVNQINVFNRSCTSNDNINATFDDQGTAIVCAVTITGNIVPTEALSIYNGESATGNWLVGIRDLAAADTGSVNSYTLTVCTQTFTLATENFGLKDFRLYPNPNNGNFTVAFESNSGNDIKINVHDISGRMIFEKTYQNNGIFNQNLQLANTQAGVYLVTVLDGEHKTTERIVIK